MSVRRSQTKRLTVGTWRMLDTVNRVVAQDKFGKLNWPRFGILQWLQWLGCEVSRHRPRLLTSLVSAPGPLAGRLRSTTATGAADLRSGGRVRSAALGIDEGVLDGKHER